MMFQYIFKNIAISIGLGSFIYLLNGVFGTLEVLQPKEIISVWIAVAIIGLVPVLYYTKISDSLVKVIQFGVGVTVFTTIALINRWITITLADILLYAGVTFIVMLIIFIAFYFLSLHDSKKINEKLDDR